MKKFYGLNDIVFHEIEQFILHSEEFSKSNLPVCLAKLNCNEKCVVYNIEQTTGKNFPFHNFNNPLIEEIWDYSEANVENFEKNGFKNVRWVKPKIWDEYRQKILSFNNDGTFDYDVVFVGWIKERRQKIINLLQKKKYTVINFESTFS